MSVQFLQSTVPQEAQTIRVNDCVIRGHSTVAEYLTVTGNVSTNGSLGFGPHPSDASKSGEITLPAMSLTQQATSTGTNVGITGDPQQFVISTFDGSIAAGATASFSVLNTACKAGKTLILLSNDVSDNTLLNVNTFVAYQADGAFIITRHNVGTVAAAGKQKIIVKLIQST